MLFRSSPLTGKKNHSLSRYTINTMEQRREFPSSVPIIYSRRRNKDKIKKSYSERVITMADKLVLAIDFNNILFGSYYGAPLINSKGMNVNAIKGFFFKLRSLKETFNPDYIVMANDLSREKTFRRRMYPPYKAQRKPHDEDIITQLKYGQQLAALMGYKFINNELYEADDRSEERRVGKECLD